MTSFHNKIVWITGASSGIGEALSYAFARQGATLILSARRLDELQRVKEQCGGARVELIPLDVSDTESLPGKVNEVIGKMGWVDILVNNAGISQRSLASDSSMEVYRRIMETNFFGTVQLCNALLPHFLLRQAGQLVIISSIAGKAGLPLRTAYCASKHALEGFVAALRVETWRTATQILIVRPGAVRTEIAFNALTGNGAANEKKDPMIENGLNPATVAEEILQAIVKGKSEINIGSHREKLLLLLSRVAPGITFNIIKKMIG